MAGNRKAAEQLCLDIIEEMLPGSQNTELYRDKFASMNDEQFEQFIDDLDKGKVHLSIISPNFSKPRLEVQRNFDIAKKIGHRFWQRIWIPARNGMPRHLSPVPYLILDLPIRRQAQLLDKKISVADDNNSVDDFTGQPTGKSKGSKISYPEVQVLAGRNRQHILTEFLKYRGGDTRGYNAMNTMIYRTGSVSMKGIEGYASEARSTTTLRTILTAMHLGSTL